jgi:hypothetical protein
MQHDVLFGAIPQSGFLRIEVSPGVGDKLHPSKGGDVVSNMSNQTHVLHPGYG